MPLAKDRNGNVLQAIRPGTDQAPVAVSGTHAESAAFGTATDVILLVCTVPCHFLVTPGGTAATTNNMLLPANTMIYIPVSPGAIISLIREGGASGTAYIQEAGPS